MFSCFFLIVFPSFFAEGLFGWVGLRSKPGLIDCDGRHNQQKPGRGGLVGGKSVTRVWESGRYGT